MDVSECDLPHRREADSSMVFSQCNHNYGQYSNDYSWSFSHTFGRCLLPYGRIPRTSKVGFFVRSCVLLVVFLVRYNGWVTSEKAEMWVLHRQNCGRSWRRLHVYLVRYIRRLHSKITSRITQFELRNHKSASVLHGNQIHNHRIVWCNFSCWRIRPSRNWVANFIRISMLCHFRQRRSGIICPISARVHSCKAHLRHRIRWALTFVRFRQHSGQLES